jgi:hypothetical protein
MLLSDIILGVEILRGIFTRLELSRVSFRWGGDVHGKNFLRDQLYTRNGVFVGKLFHREGDFLHDLKTNRYSFI